MTMFICLRCGCETTKGLPHKCAEAPITTIGVDPSAPGSERTAYGVHVRPGYDDLFTVLHRALDQAQNGKGSDRHANGEAFSDQPIMTITRRHGLGFALGQSEKKITEAHGMVRRGELAAAEREFLGAINYVAAAILRLHELEAQKGK